MGLRLEHDSGTGITHLIGEGTFQDADLEQVMRDGEHRPLLLSGGGVLLDLRAVDGVEITSRALSDAATNPSAQNSTVRAIKLAIVGESDEAYGIGRAFQGWRNEDETLKVFRDHAAALAWLLER